MARLSQNPVSVLRVVGLLEAFSFLILVFVAMPLKYAADQPGPVRYVGMAHGVLFLAFVAVLLWTWAAARWPVGRVGLLLLASLFPAGPIIVDKRVVRYADEYDRQKTTPV
jgi:integral membrane protein